MFNKILLSILFSISVFAGDRKGNGGDVLTCEPVSKYHLWSLDWYEMLYRYKLKPNFPDLDSDVSSALKILERIKDISPRRYEKLSKLVREFYFRSKFTRFPLSDVRDSGVYEIPEDCQLSQAVNQNPDILPSNKYYLINETIWNQLNLEMKTSLILHEVIYKSQDFKTSENLRKYVSFLIADEFHLLSLAQYNQKLKNLGFLKNEINGLEVDLMQDFQFWDDTSLMFAMPVPYSEYEHQKINYRLRSGPVTFYQNGKLASFCPDSIYRHRFHFGSMELRCDIWEMDYSPIEFYPSGKLKSGIVDFEMFEQQEIRVLSPSANDGLKHTTMAKFYENGYLAELDKAGIIVSNDKNVFFTDRKNKVVFHKNGVLKRAKLEAGSSWNYGNGRLLIQAWVDFYDNFQIKEALAIMDFKFFVQDQNLLFVGGHKVQFYENSKLRSAVLGEDVLLKDRLGNFRELKSGQRLFFNERGLLF
ncbi:MAG: hypothetical protein VX642_07455 [Bdellovibrionota bacterium]|nr:hypothetical protein [Bdellovibrionota bacterium]